MKHALKEAKRTFAQRPYLHVVGIYVQPDGDAHVDPDIEEYLQFEDDVEDFVTEYNNEHDDQLMLVSNTRNGLVVDYA